MRTIFGFVCVTLIYILPTIHAIENIIVHTNYGDVLGYQTDIARVFYGIPFAQPPVDELRWNPPTPISKWAPKIINATVPAPACPQPPCSVPSPLCPTVFSEDCLYLNIFTPLSDSSSLSSPLPVMIFISGGDFQWLSASIALYEAERFVNTTNIVCVSIQYRLGVLGFLASGTGPNDFKGNYGILDQRLGIAWIKENIGAFGGDPNQITLFGESAGAQSVALHYISSEMQSFFQAAIIQSAPMTIPFRTYPEYFTPTALLAEQLHCAVSNLSCFRAASYQDIIVAQQKVNNMITSFKFLLFFEQWVPVIDNVVVRGQLIDTVQNISFSLKPLVIGTVAEEAFGLLYTPGSKPFSPTLYVEAILGAYREHGLKVLERYPPEGTGDQRPIFAKILTQWVFACSTRVFARKAGSYLYVFGYPPDFDGWLFVPECKGHVCHGDELSYMFESAWYNFTDAGRRVSQSMATSWTNFGKSQDPNQPVSLRVQWPRASINESYLYFQDPLDVRKNYLKEDCDFWDTIGYK